MYLSIGSNSFVKIIFMYNPMNGFDSNNPIYLFSKFHWLCKLLKEIKTSSI